jgi:hypothetical protein
MASTWHAVETDLDWILRPLSWGSFVIIEYDVPRLGDDAPYVQAAPDPCGCQPVTDSESSASGATALPARALPATAV